MSWALGLVPDSAATDASLASALLGAVGAGDVDAREALAILGGVLARARRHRVRAEALGGGVAARRCLAASDALLGAAQLALRSVRDPVARAQLGDAGYALGVQALDRDASRAYFRAGGTSDVGVEQDDVDLCATVFDVDEAFGASFLDGVGRFFKGAFQALGRMAKGFGKAFRKRGTRGRKRVRTPRPRRSQADVEARRSRRREARTERREARREASRLPVEASNVVVPQSLPVVVSTSSTTSDPASIRLQIRASRAGAKEAAAKARMLRAQTRAVRVAKRASMGGTPPWWLAFYGVESP